MIGRITDALILTTLAVWVLWDVYAFHVGGTPVTESGTIRRWSQHPLLPFAAGILAGHFWACPL